MTDTKTQACRIITFYPLTRFETTAPCSRALTNLLSSISDESYQLTHIKKVSIEPLSIVSQGKDMLDTSR